MNNEQQKKIFTISIILIIIAIIFRLLYLYFKKPNTIENFSEVKNLVNKVQDAGVASTDKPSWTNILMSIDFANVKPISFWHPTAPTGYLKLGDMISLDPNFKPPTDKALFVNGETKKATEYELIVDVGTKLSGVYNIIKSRKALEDTLTELQSLFNVIPNYNTYLATKKNQLVAKLADNYLYNNYLEIIQNNTNNTTTSLENYNLRNLMPNNLATVNGTNYIEINLGEFTKCNLTFNLPANCKIGFVRTNKLTSVVADEYILNVPEIDPITFDLTNTSLNTVRKNIYNSLPTNFKGKVIMTTGSTGEQFINYSSIKFNNEDLDIQAKLSDITTLTEISNILNNIKTQINNYINNATDKSIILYYKNKLEAFINYVNTLISLYRIVYVTAHVNFTTNLSYLYRDDKNEYTYSLKIYTYSGSLNRTTTLIANNLSNDFFDLSKYETLLNNIQDTPNNVTYYSRLQNILDDVNSLNVIKTKLNSNEDIFPTLRIFKPIAPKGYKVLGHIFGDDNDTVEILNKSYDNKKIVACVPEHCTREVRPWQKSDMVYEYNYGNKYFAIYYNPLCGTFMCVNNRNELPEGKITKIVACVEKCTVVDDLIKADDCARKFLDKNKAILAETPMESKLTSDLENQYYMDKITSKSKQIALLENKARQLQVLSDKVDIVNRENNKNKLQNYVDRQRFNINSIVDRLRKDRYKIDIDVKIPIETLNQIITDIKTMPNLSDEDKENLIQSIKNNEKLKSAGIMTQEEYNQRLNDILKSCPSYDLSQLVKKSVVSDVCYGCDNP